MMMPDWGNDARLRTAAFAFLNIAAGLAIYGFILGPISNLFLSREAQIADQHALLTRLNAMAAQEERIQAFVRETGAQLKGGEFLVGLDEGVVNADLQTRLKGMVGATGARLRSIQALQPKVRDRTKYIGSRLEIFGTLRAIQRVIHGVEGGTPYLFIAAADLRPSPVVSTPGSAEEPGIDARLDIYGAMQIEGREQ
jgi:hypothetical protein